MKKWSFIILSAFLVFLVVAGSPNIWRVRLAAATSIQPITVITNHTLQLLPAQTTDAEIQTVSAMQPHPVSISPYEIKRLIDKNNLAARRKQTYELDLKPIQKQLKFGDNPDSGLYVDVCKGDCEAEIFNLELDGRPGKETILRLHPDMTGLYNHLIFKQAGARSSSRPEWILLGRIDTNGWMYGLVPQYRVVTAGPERWLAINYGFGHRFVNESEVERWYEVKAEDGVVEVLAYQSRIYDAAFEDWLGIKRSTKLLETEYKDGVAVIVLQSSSFYEANLRHNDPFPFMTTKRKVTFKKARAAQRFVYDPLHSELSSKELEPEFGNEGAITDAEFLKYNYRELAWIAARGNAKQRAWLRNHLKGRDESLEKQSLQKALEEEQP
jgi:hypothetical protein